MPAHTTNAVTRNTRAALDVLERAETVGLPLPYVVSASSYGDGVTIHLDGIAELAQWALWLENPISDSPHADHVHHSTVGTVDGNAVECTAISRAQA